VRVGLNATCFGARPSGARQRFVELYGELFRIRPEIEFIVYEPSDFAVRQCFRPFANVAFKRTPLPGRGRLRRLVRGQGYWRGVAQADRLDLFEQFHFPLAPVGIPAILTVHDARWAGSPLLRLVMRLSMRRADRIVTVSATMMAELSAIEPACAIRVVHNGIAPARFSRGERTPLAPARAPYLLAVGHLERRKNYPGLIRALALLRAAGHDIDLVIVGRRGESDDDWPRIERAIAQAGLQDRVTVLSEVDDEALPGLYAGCALVVFPSRYEGFGIPLLEAMAARRPLVCSDIPVFRELTEGRLAYFRADEPAEIARAVGEVLHSRPRQDSLIAYGAQRLAAFRPERLAGEIAALYRELISARAASPMPSTPPAHAPA
jgi:glycosyltransferase involved in cell wall biosynthesis